MTWRNATGREISLEIVTLAKIYSYSKHKRRKDLTKEDLAFIPKFNQTIQRLVSERLLRTKSSVVGKPVYSITEKGVQLLKNLEILQEAFNV